MAERYQLVSLLDMHPVEIANVLAAAAYLNATASEFRLQAQLVRQGVAAPPDLSQHTRIWILKSLERVVEFSRAMGFRASERAAARAFDQALPQLAARGTSADRLDEISRSCASVAQTLGDELQGFRLYSLDPRHARFLEEQSPFGTAIEDAFPDASADILEAARCRALGRWTASVMHLMRAMEVGLAALAAHHDLRADNNWNQTLNQIEASTRSVNRREHGAEAEQWAAEAATHLRFVKNAWRNHAMHPRASYSEERAITIYESTAEFMKHLAQKLTSEGGLH